MILFGQFVFASEIVSILNFYQFFNTSYIYFETVNYFALFAIQISLIFSFLTFLKGKLRYTLPVLLLPVIGQIMEGVYVLLITKGERTRIRYTVFFFLLFFLSVIASHYVYVPSGFPAGVEALQLFGFTLIISDVFNVALLAYLFFLFRTWDKYKTDEGERPPQVRNE